MTHPDPQDPTTTETEHPPAKREGDPLGAAARGETEGTEGSRQGPDPADQG